MSRDKSITISCIVICCVAVAAPGTKLPSRVISMRIPEHEMYADMLPDQNETVTLSPLELFRERSGLGRAASSEDHLPVYYYVAAGERRVGGRIRAGHTSERRSYLRAGRPLSRAMFARIDGKVRVTEVPITRPRPKPKLRPDDESEDPGPATVSPSEELYGELGPDGAPADPNNIPWATDSDAPRPPKKLQGRWASRRRPKPRPVDGRDVGGRVTVRGYRCTGTLRFFGPHSVEGTPRCGVELDLPVGKNGGTVEGHAYFTAGDNCGVLVKPAKVTLAEPSESAYAEPEDAIHIGGEDIDVASDTAFSSFLDSSVMLPPAPPPPSVPAGQLHLESGIGEVAATASATEGTFANRRLVAGHAVLGTLRFVGSHNDEGRPRVGVELVASVSKNAGTVNGQCPTSHGVLTQPKKVAVAEVAEASGEVEADSQCSLESGAPTRKIAARREADSDDGEPNAPVGVLTSTESVETTEGTHSVTPQGSSRDVLILSVKADDVPETDA